MNRKAGGWDQNVWLGKADDLAETRGAWGRMPSIIRAALVWAFLKNGPNEVEDLARLHDGLCFGQRGPIALAEREEPRWMAENLLRLLPTLSRAQVDVGVSIFMSPMIPRSVKNRRIKASEDTAKEDTWGLARKGEENLRPEEAIHYKCWLPDLLPNREDFLIWLFKAWDNHLTDRRQRQSDARKADPDFTPLADPNGVYEEGRKFPVDMGEWWLQKQLFNNRKGLLWGYKLWRTNGTIPKSPYKIYSAELQRGVYPNGGLLCVRPSRPNAFIGGATWGLSNFNALVRSSLDAVLDARGDQHIEALMDGLDLEALKEKALGKIPYILTRWWWNQGLPKFKNRHIGMTVRKARTISPWFAPSDSEKLSN